MMSIRKLKLCGESILKPLELIFRFCIENIKHLNNWKKVNVVPVHKKSHKQVLKNYRPIPLLPICGKKFERLIFNKMFKFFVDNDLTSPYQSRFKRGDSGIDQVFSVTHVSIHLLTIDLKLKASLLIYQKTLIKVGMKNHFKNLIKICKMLFQVMC